MKVSQNELEELAKISHTVIRDKDKKIIKLKMRKEGKLVIVTSKNKSAQAETGGTE